MKKMITVLTAAVMLSGMAAPISSAAVTEKVNTSAVVSLNVAPSGVPVVSSKSTDTSVTLSWEKVKNATGYRVYRYIGGKWTKVKTTKSLSYTDGELSSAKVYKYKVKAYNKKNGKVTWGKACDTYRTATAPKQTSFKTSSKSYNAVRLNWNAVDCSGYQIFMLEGGKWNKITTLKNETKAETYKVENLAENTKYSFKVRPYYLYDGKLYYAKSTAINLTTKEKRIEWTDLDKAYYHMCLGYPSNEEIEMVSADISNYIVDKYSEQYKIRRDTNLWRVFGMTSDETFCYNFNERKLIAKKDVAEDDKVDDAKIDYSVELPCATDLLIPLKDGYNDQNYKEIQWYRNKCYEWLGDGAIKHLVNNYGLEEYIFETEYVSINITACCIPDGQSCGGIGDYYDDKDPMNIPQYSLFFCHDFHYVEAEK